MGGVQTSPVLHSLVAFVLAAGVSLAVVPLRAVAGLRCYYAPDSAEGEAAEKRGGRRVKARGGKGGAAPSKKDDDYDLGGAETLVLAPLALPLVYQLKYHNLFDNLVGGRPAGATVSLL